MADRIGREIQRNRIAQIVGEIRRSQSEPGFEIETFGDLREQNATFGWGLNDRELAEAWRLAERYGN